MKDSKKIVAEKIYVVCPAGIKTGGPELLHQLVFTLNKNGFCAHIAYAGNINHSYKIIDEYRQYINSYLLLPEIEDSPENLVIVPETNVFILKKYKNIQKAIWWLSVDNFYLRYFSMEAIKYRISAWGFLRFVKRSFFTRSVMNPENYLSMDSKLIRSIHFHLCQSIYAVEECKKHSLAPIYLSDYLNDEFFSGKTGEINKENIVVYSPAKGFKFTNKIIKRNPDINFVPIENMTRMQVLNLLARAKVYIDFGNHPGKDRIPREARMQGCIVITGKNGSAKYFEDVSIEEKFDKSPKNISVISTLIKQIFDNYAIWNNKQIDYTNFIKTEKEVFNKDVVSIFGA